MSRVCYTRKLDDNSIVIVKEGAVGFWPSPGMTAAAADEKNAALGVSHAMREAMTVGSMFGWDVPGADLEAAATRFPQAKPLA